MELAGLAGVPEFLQGIEKIMAHGGSRIRVPRARPFW
jgi:hypothetical protein